MNVANKAQSSTNLSVGDRTTSFKGGFHSPIRIKKKTASYINHLNLTTVQEKEKLYEIQTYGEDESSHSFDEDDSMEEE